jgi:hypothetical protein
LPGDTEPSIAGKLACGAAAGVFGQTVTYPLDVVRRQMQVKFLPVEHKSLFQFERRGAVGEKGTHKHIYSSVL